MKTIQTAIATSLHFLKLPLLVMAVFFSFLIGEPLPVPQSTATFPIGGQSAPRHYVVNNIDTGFSTIEMKGPMDIGILQNLAYSSSIGEPLLSTSISFPIGGTQGIPRQLKSINGSSIVSCSFADIGGNGSATPPRTIFEAKSVEITSTDCLVFEAHGIPRINALHLRDDPFAATV